MTGIVVGVLVLVLIALIGFGLSIRVVREYQRVLLFRFGRAVGLRGPGLVLINPVTDRTSWVDLREQFLEIPRQTAITEDNAPISIDFIIFTKVVDAVMSVVARRNACSGTVYNNMNRSTRLRTIRSRTDSSGFRASAA